MGEEIASWNLSCLPGPATARSGQGPATSSMEHLVSHHMWIGPPPPRSLLGHRRYYTGASGTWFLGYLIFSKNSGILR